MTRSPQYLVGVVDTRGMIRLDNDSGGPFVDQHFEQVLVLSQFPRRCFQVETVVQNKVSQ